MRGDLLAAQRLFRSLLERRVSRFGRYEWASLKQMLVGGGSQIASTVTIKQAWSRHILDAELGRIRHDSMQSTEKTSSVVNLIPGRLLQLGKSFAPDSCL